MQVVDKLWTGGRRIGCLLGVCLLLIHNAWAGNGEIRDGKVIAKWHYQALSANPSDQGLGFLDVFLEDAASHQPMAYQTRQLAAWLQPDRKALSDSESACADKLRMLAAQGIGQRAEIDLSSWRLLTINSDRTLAFINPFVGINNAKLESILTLPGDIDSWLLQAQRQQLWLHVRDGQHSGLVSVDTQRRKIDQRIDTPLGMAKLALDGDGSHIWVLSGQAGKLAVVDSTTRQAALQIASIPGLTGLLAAADNGVFVWSADAAQLLLWRVNAQHQPQNVRQWNLPAPVQAASWSSQARRLLLALADGSIAWMDPSQAEQTMERIVAAGPHGTHLSDLALFDDGRYLLWLDKQAALAGVVDVASARELLQVKVVDAADSIAFSKGFAYLHSASKARASVLSLADLRSGRAQPVEISTGQTVDVAMDGQRMVADPGGQGMLIANPQDGVVYQYAEGMMAPMGSYSNYRRSALGIMVLDNGLTQVGPGHFRALIRNQHGGPHDLILGGVEPRFSACARLDLPAPAPDQTASAAAAPAIKATLAELQPEGSVADLSRKVRVSLEQNDQNGKSRPLTGVRDLTLLVFDRRNAWQDRLAMQEVEPGWYQTQVRLPRGGRYDWQVRSLEQALSYQAGRLGTHDVVAR